jgi:hypothetical protein
MGHVWQAVADGYDTLFFKWEGERFFNTFRSQNAPVAKNSVEYMRRP